MKTDIYLHHNKHLCVFVEADERHKFIDDVEKICPNWSLLLEEAKNGFDGFPFYDRYENGDRTFWDQYLDIIEGYDDNYEYLGSVVDDSIQIDSENLENKGDYFAPLLAAVKIAEIYGFGILQDIVYADDYLVLSSDCELLVCSKFKIPFEPNPKQKQLRELMRSKLIEMKPYEEGCLCAKYGTSSPRFSDIENTLFYNIGVSAFHNVLNRDTAVLFEKMQRNEMEPCEQLGFEHLYRYVCSIKDKSKNWWEHMTVCQWDEVSVDKINSSSKATDWFLAIKRSLDKVECLDDTRDANLGLKIKLSVPKNSNFKDVINTMKPMIDGIVCAFHAPKEILVDEVSAKLKIDKEVFLSAEKTCLAERKYVDLYRNSVKWDPKDEILDFVQIEPVMVDSETATFSGKLFALPCYM